MPDPSISNDEANIAKGLEAVGYVRLEAPQTFHLLGADARPSWDEFVRSWDELGPDLYMADGGRYRRRRYAAFAYEKDGGPSRKPHQPHYQSRDYNPLNGDIHRWFEPVSSDVAENPVTQAIFRLCFSAIEQASAAAAPKPWHIEFHQFRIETLPDHVGRPTPEGLHRDGVDWVFVMLVQRTNVRDGVTEIGSSNGERLGRFLLKEPGDAVILDDHRILHGVTEIHAIDPERPAYRDVLVVTFAQRL